ncbi:MAG: winged helix DNA-binding domain-containing protein [Chloroflexota bacterium]
MTGQPISTRALNRATLARQGLLEPISGASIPDAVARVGSLQAQHPEWPPVALWTRTADDAVKDLATALADRTVVRAALMRITVQVVRADHFWPIAQLTQGLRAAQFKTFFKADVADSKLGRRLTETHAAVRAALKERPLRIRDMDAIMKAETPELADAPNRLHWRHLAASIPLVHVPFDGEGYGRSRYAAAEDWIGPPPPDLDEATSARLIAERYLAAFGPASVDDLMSYVGKRGSPARWRSAIAALGERAVTFTAEDGRVLHDLQDAPRPGEDAVAAPRLLARWDSLLLSHAASRRERVIADGDRARVYTKNADVLPTLLVDGTVAGTWNRAGGTVTVQPFQRLDRATRAVLEEQATRLAHLLAPEDEARVVVAR